MSGKVVHSWIDHPIHGVLHRRGDFKHESIMKDHDIENRENPAKGRFVVNHDKKYSLLQQYKGSGNTHQPLLGSHLRHELRVPASYGHHEATA